MEEPIEAKVKREESEAAEGRRIMSIDAIGRREQQEIVPELNNSKVKKLEEQTPNPLHSITPSRPSHQTHTKHFDLPNSPSSPTTPSIKQENHQELINHHPTSPPSFSLWDHLKVQLNPELDHLQLNPNSNTLKSQRVSNFLHVPISVEKFIGFGFFICLDSFLAVFTILPIKFFLASLSLLSILKDRLLHPIRTFLSFRKKESNLKEDGGSKYRPKTLPVSSKIDLIQGLLIILVCVFLHHVTDASRMYHSVRGQDILDSLFSASTLGRRIDGTRRHMKPIFLFTLALIFTDIVERFQMFLMLTIIAIRNLIELSGSSTATSAGSHQPSYTHQYLPASFNLTPSISLVEKTFSPVLVVMLSEVLVDWLKHAFITKFNHIRPSVYGRFIDLLCKDLVGADQVDQAGSSDQEIKPFVDRSPVVSRRLGFSVLPMFCLTVRVSFQAINMLSDTSEEDFTTTLHKKNTNYSDYSVNPAKFSFLGLVKLQLHLIHSTVFGNSNNYSKQSDPQFNPLSNIKTHSTLDYQVAGRGGSSKFSNFQINGFIILSVIIVMIFLILIKLYLGIQIRSFAMRRVESLNERISEDELNGKNRIPIGVTNLELKRDEVDKNLLERAEFELPLREAHQVSHPYSSTSCPPSTKAYQPQQPPNSDLPNSNYQVSSIMIDQKPPAHLLPASASSSCVSSTLPLAPNVSSKNADKKKGLSMDELSRFDMVRSRIW